MRESESKAFDNETSSLDGLELLQHTIDRMNHVPERNLKGREKRVVTKKLIADLALTDLNKTQKRLILKSVVSPESFIRV